MRPGIDVGVLISGLPVRPSLSMCFVILWRENCFDLLSLTAQANELLRVAHYPMVPECVTRALADRQVHELCGLAPKAANPINPIRRCTRLRLIVCPSPAASPSLVASPGTASA